jgi:hypothetical protein
MDESGGDDPCAPVAASGSGNGKISRFEDHHFKPHLQLVDLRKKL